MEVSDGWVVRPLVPFPQQRPSTCSSPPPSQVFPGGLPEEFTLVFTLALKKAALRDTVYLLQISDQQGYPQVSSLSPHPPLLPFILISCPSLFCIRVHFHPPFIPPPPFPDIFSIRSPSRRVFCALPSIIVGSPLSLTFIAIHAPSMMKRRSPRESP